MDQEKLAKIESDLTDALATFNWAVAKEICQDLINRIYEEKDVFPVFPAKKILAKLRRKRQFRLMSKVGEAIIRSDQTNPQILRQYAQSLIDQDIFSAAELVLQLIIQTPDTSVTELVEAHGLKGRIYKQLYVGVTGNSNSRKKIFFEKALNSYLHGYRLDRRNYWNAINVVALLKRGKRDGISFHGMPNADKVAKEVLAILKENEEKSNDSPPAWEVATNLEALIALGSFDEATQKALDYSLCFDKDADAFEFHSTIRQLIEVWQLNDEESPGSEILPILRGALLKREGGVVNLTPQQANREFENLEQMLTEGLEIKKAEPESENLSQKKGYEKNFTQEEMQSLGWISLAIKRTQSIARIENIVGEGVGTGWLVKSADFFSNCGGDEVLLVTNSHVVSADPADEALMPQHARINFQGINKVYQVEKIIWNDSRNNLDTTFLKIKGNPQIEPLPVNQSAVEMCEPPPRVYVIGHPKGGEIRFSLHNSHLVACNERLLHYRTPTEPGSSGSPVFDGKFWEVVALHHSGKNDMPRLDGKAGTYEANEGITVLAIKKAIENGV